jgi:hypothetical protein
MMASVLDALVVFGGFALVYAAVPLLALGRRGGVDGADRVGRALCAGMAVQSLAGFACNHLAAGRPGLSAVAYFAVWAAAALAARRRGVEVPRPAMGGAASAALLLILAAGVGLRLVHPLQHMALGQSDAYGHLQFLRDVVGDGRVGNVVYPPGYAWILALPTMLLGFDPYAVARYGGAFFGAALILAVFSLARSGWGVAAGLVAAFLAACFPLFLLLQKTSVGCFANQWGLALIPACAVLLCAILGGDRRAGWMLALLMASLAVSVPMMGISVVTICGAGLAAAPLGWKPRMAAARVLLAAALPAAALLAVHVSLLPRVHREVTANIVAGGGAPVRAEAEPGSRGGGVAAPALRPVADFLSVKRRGYGSGAVNAAAAGVAAAFAAALVAGRSTSAVFPAVLGAWGLLASAQSATGWLQFTAYQREGWSLLIACACLGGFSGAACVRLAGRRIALAAAAAAASAAWAFAHPPAHRFTYSDAEEDIARAVRTLAGCGAASPAAAQAVADLGGRRDWVLMARAFTGFSGHQGDPVRALAGPAFAGRILSVDGEADPARAFAGHRRVVVLLDGEAADRPAGGLLPGWQAGHYAGVLEVRRALMQTNRRIEDALRALDPAAYEIAWFDAGPALRIARVTRAHE